MNIVPPLSRRTRRRASGYAAPLVLAAISRVALAQPEAGDGMIRGRIVDAAGAPVRHAQVVAREARTGVERGAAVDASGAYVLRALRPGEYTLRVRAVGYQPVTRPLGAVAAGQVLAVDVRLSAAAAALAQQVVTAARSPVSVAAVPGAVTVVTREQLAAQTQVAPRLGPALAQLVPGLGATTETVSNFGQNIRGRTVLVLIDGVPQSTSRNVSRDLVNIDPAAVERVEVIRGATALYGDGATGGVINIITRRPEAGPVRFATDVSTEASLSRPGAAGLGPRVSQRITGGQGRLAVVASGTASRTGALFDADGDRVPPDPTGQGGFAETNSYDLLGKVSYAVSGRQRLGFTVNRFQSRQGTDFASDFSVNALPAYQQKARALPGLELARGQGTGNTLANAEYVHDALFGSRVRMQAYARDYHTVFRPFDDRRYRTLTDTLAGGSSQTRRVYTGGYVMQTYVNSAKGGGRLELESPLLRRAAPRLGATLLWGADYTNETTEQPVYTYDSAAFVASRGTAFRKVGDRVFVPPIDQRSLGLFAQFAATPVPRALVRAGVRRERATLAFDDFTALNSVPVAGGALRFRPLLANAGAVLTVSGAVSAFANYSQGFSLADVGRVIREPARGFTLGSREARPQRVDQVEAGVRGAWRPAQASLAAFRNTSALGTSVGPNLEVVRAPERVRGVEGTLDVQPGRGLGAGGTVSWTEGEFYTRVGADSVWQPLNTFRIQPLKLTAYAEHRTRAGWTNRVQVLHSGARDRAYDAFLRRPGVNPAAPGFGERRVAAYTLVDVLSRVDLGRGALTLGVRNLLNAQYFPVVSQLMPVGNASYSAAPGATLSAGYSVAY